MSGPVWRFESTVHQACSSCFRTVEGMYVEGEVVDNDFRIDRTVCPDCYGRWNRLVVAGELGAHTPGPAYVRKH